jgi:hypothetical protein
MTSILRTTLIMLLGCLLVGCLEQSRYHPPQGTLDESLYFYESAISDQEFDISGTDANVATHTTKRVPGPALVDMDSTVHIQIDGEKLHKTAGLGLSRSVSNALVEKKQRIEVALTSLASFVETRKQAIIAYQGEDSNAFFAARDAFLDAETRLEDELKALWPQTTHQYIQIDNIFLNLGQDPALVGLHDFLQAQITTIETQDRALAKDIQKKRGYLRLQAHISRPAQKDPIFIHLEHYDTLATGHLEKRDRWGLNLSPQEQAILTDQIEATQKLTALAEQVRQKEVSLQDALLQAAPVVSQRLAQDLNDLDTLARAYHPQALRDKLDRIELLTKELTQELVDAITDPNGLSEDLRKQLDALPEAFRVWLQENGSTQITEVLSLIGDIQTLRAHWRHPQQPDRQTLIVDSANLFLKVNRTTGNLGDLVDVNQLDDFLSDQAAKLEVTLYSQLKMLVSGETTKELRTLVTQIATDIGHFYTLLNNVGEELGLFGGSTVTIESPSKETLLVDLGDIKNTWIDLRRTPRLAGDEIILKATLLNAQETELDTSTASLQVERFGWHARLSPAVALVKPDQLNGAYDDFRFAPTLSWLHTYTPRPVETQWSANLCRSLEPCAGIHTAFLNFETDQGGSALQIGLGATLSFWDKRLQLGAGTNLMADSQEHGRFYYFIGTDLIGILQSLGWGQ